MLCRKKETDRIIIDTQVLLDLTGWDINQLMNVLMVPEVHRDRIIKAITRD
ncbi:MAG: hypothetical protein IKS32_10640 [Solobacterium sp.]|nr:hypothetical protein [Solobacterium sp.]